MKKRPCKNCTKRTVGCHISCKDYKLWRADLDRANAERAKEEQTIDYVAKTIEKNRKG